ncbi:MAG: nicotinate-nucleotide adenylyltransferase [Halioglobus sp.]
MIDGAPASVAVFGGTFDPIHNGHLRSALELAERLELGEVRMMPCASPPHRGTPAGSADHRAAMLELAVAGEPRLSCDRRELDREGLSYTIDSLVSLRGELGEQCSISLIMGCDAVLDLASWHRWDELLDWAHVVLIARPGWQFPEQGPVARWLQAHRCDSEQQLKASSAGCVMVEELRPLPISASEIRDIVRTGRSARYLLPASVLDYIFNHSLYL